MILLNIFQRTNTVTTCATTVLLAVLTAVLVIGLCQLDSSKYIYLILSK